MCIRDSFGTGDPQTLAVLDGVHELAGFEPVDPDELGTLRRLRQDEPTQASPLEKRRIAPDFHRDPDACQECHRMPCVCDVRPLIGGPLGEGD